MPLPSSAAFSPFTITKSIFFSAIALVNFLGLMWRFYNYLK